MIKYNYCGYFTQNKRMEKFIVDAVPDAVNIILDGHLNKIDTVRIIFMKNKIYNWGYEFNRLYQNRTIEIKIPRTYRSINDAGWLIQHELCHVKQILDGELKTGIDVIHYKNKRYKILYNGDLQINFSKRKIKNTFPNKEYRPWEKDCKVMVKHYNTLINRFRS